MAEIIVEHQGCPYCNKPALPKDEQPYPGTHAFSVKYKCGGQVVYIISDPNSYWEWEQQCPTMAILPEEIDDGK